MALSLIVADNQRGAYGPLARSMTSNIFVRAVAFSACGALAGMRTMVSITSRLGASKLFTDLAREVAPANPELGTLTEVGARHRLKFAEQARTQ